AQKLLRPDNGGAPTSMGSQAKDSDDTSPIENTNVDDQDALLTTELACAIFGDSPLTHESSAVGYLVSLKSQATPSPMFDDYLTYMQRVSSGTSMRNLDRAWARMKQFLSDDSADFSTFENLIDLVSLVSVFKEISTFTTSGSALSSATAKPPPPQLPRPLQTPTPPAASSSSPPASSAPVSISGSNGSGSTSGSSSNSRSKVAPGQILTMKNLFNANFDKFDGGGWSLPSGAVVDDRLRRVIEVLPYESALHSFIVEDVDTVLRLFDDAKDREEITNTMYNRPPKDLHEFLLNHGCGSVGDALEEKLSEEFRIVVHDCITQVLRNYQRNFIGILGPPTQETTCLDTRQYMGHKVDGVVVISKRPVEICWIEAAKKDGGVNTSKCLHDTKKLMKLMKDGHDMIREKAEQDIRCQLATFALRISGPSISIFTLRQRQGRFYQAAAEETISLPLTWLDKEDTTQVLAVIARILKLRKAIQVMAASISTWTQSTIDDESSGVKDWIAPTMTSPQLLPVAPTSYATNALVLDI
ncbi:hypothetical protein BGZ98_001819, partial [Dissophora globulifera]